MARPKPELVLTDDEKQTLARWANRPKSTQRLALRARIVLACADETSNKAVAARLGVERPVAKPLHDIAMASPTEGWIGGSFQNTPPTLGLLLHYTGGQWTMVDNGQNAPLDPNDPAARRIGSDLYAIQMVSPTEGWAVGALDTIAHLQDGVWTRYSPPPTPEAAP